MKAQLISFLCACVVPLLAWVGGYNFDTRGATAVGITLMTIVVYALAITCPLFPAKWRKW